MQAAMARPRIRPSTYQTDCSLKEKQVVECRN
jgi:hypothetical protein